MSGVLVLTALSVVGIAGPASAHVTITPSTTQAGATAVLTVGVPHGCGDSPTTRMDVLLPQGVGEVEAVPDPRWNVAGPSPQQGGGAGSSLVLSFVAVAPLPDAEQDTVEFSVVLPDSEGATLAFPTIQRCQDTESAWTEVPTGGQDAASLQMPAPSFEITGNGSAGAPEPTAVQSPPVSPTDAASPEPTSTDLRPAAEAETPARDTSTSSAGGPYAVVGVAAAAVVLIGVAAMLTRRRRTRSDGS